jgi:tetratricopeptide (TPR) repeat protein
LAFAGYGDLERAKAYLDEAIPLSASIQNEWATAMSLFGMGRVAGVMGDLATARTKFLQSADLAKKMGNKRQMYSCYSELAHVLRENGELEEPLAIYRDLLPKWKEIGHRAAVAHELECIAYILAKGDEPQQAAAILGAAAAMRKGIDSAPTPLEQVEYDRELAAMRENLTDAEFQQAWRQGQKLTMDEAIALAIQDR